MQNHADEFKIISMSRGWASLVADSTAGANEGNSQHDDSNSAWRLINWLLMLSSPGKSALARPVWFLTCTTRAMRMIAKQLQPA